MTKTIFIAAAIFGLAAPAMSAEPLTIRIPTAGLDLSTSEGRATLAKRAERIAQKECGDVSSFDLRGAKTVRECRASVMAAVQRHTAQSRLADATR